MQPGLRCALDAYRSSRRFDPARYIDAKAVLLNAYFTHSGISGCVVGVSGGVDSAVTLGIIAYAARKPGSPIRRILALLLPMHGEGATHQDTALSQGAEVAAAFGVPCVTIDLSSTLAAARQASEYGTDIKGTAWASGQLVSYLRTPMLYYQTALLAEQGFPAVVCGTTNRDEGSYIGFFGKASDGMVDIQPISDAHKSEVYQLAEQLGVPRSVCTAVPTGDTYDGACDEDMIGAPYDALELYTWYLCIGPEEREAWRSSLCPDAQREFVLWVETFEGLHQKNYHKYVGDSPAVHFDVYMRAVPGGWRNQEVEQSATAISREAALAARIGPVELDRRIKHTLGGAPRIIASLLPLADFGDSAVLLSGILSPDVCDEFLRDADNWTWLPADLHGRPICDNGKSVDGGNIRIGSYRATAYDEEIAQLLWDRLAPMLPGIRVMCNFTPTDWSGHPVWRPTGVNPMLRFIRYEKGGALVPHYDAGFDFKDGRRHTLMSVVITLTPPSPPSQAPGGSTRFLVDQQRFLPLDERNFEDQVSLPSPRDVLVEVPAKRGDALVFDHRVLHDGSTWKGIGPRILLRTDIIYERCAPRAVCDPKYAPTPPSPEKWAHDPIFRKAFEILRSMEAMEEAGYFNDGLEGVPSSDPRWWSAPLDKLLKNLEQRTAQDASRELFVLVSTGAFCPVHAGHLEMMERAKNALKERGHVVLGGYLAPDHDEYVLAKCGPEAVFASQRLDLCERAVRDSDWLMVERWGALHVPTAVNFTIIIERIQKYLARWMRTHRPIHVAFVFGSDNARFAKAFVGRGFCICVLRPGYDAEFQRVAEDPMVRHNARIVFCRNATAPWASCEVRQGNVEALPREVKAEWVRRQKLDTVSHNQEGPNVTSLYVRNEGDWAVQHWVDLPGMDAMRIQVAYRVFFEGLLDTLEQAFSRGRKLDGGPHVRIVTLDLHDQKSLFQSLTQSKPTISLDPCLPGTVNLEISRCFEPLSEDSVFVARPGADSLTAQLERLSNIPHVLFDDDTFSGRTGDYVQRLIRARCSVDKFITLCDANGPLGEKRSDHPPRLNLVDCRDFLAGAREAGLVLRLPDGTVCRAPYLLPYVRPYHRASIFVSEEINFSRRVWQLNKQFFTSVGAILRISAMSLAFQNLCEAQGFPAAMTMEAYCDWHLEHLGAATE